MGIDKRLLETLEANGRQELSDEEKRKRNQQWKEFIAEARKRPPAKRRRRIHFRSPIVIEYESDFD
ncbi:MAG: hypothetical protein OXG07_03660 [Anaerolineaceae bacterium]|nr:hypothetical protein [Anaerolineaceae bacterium]MCY3906332.1 hypothetical protein [Anaerolineaceae bacterium]